MSTVNQQNQPTDTVTFIKNKFNIDVSECINDNLVTDCENPPSIEQLDFDLKSADKAIKELTESDREDKQVALLMYQSIYSLLKVMKCTSVVNPCYGINAYSVAKKYLSAIQSKPFTEKIY